MKLISFGFNKIKVEKLSESFKGVKLSTKIDISDINSVESGLFKGDESLIRVRFTYSVEYTPNVANLEIGGDILLSMENKQSKELLESWKENKISEDFRVIVFNIILKKANVKALDLEEQLNLPLHIPMPSIKKGKKQ